MKLNACHIYSYEKNKAGAEIFYLKFTKNSCNLGNYNAIYNLVWRVENRIANVKRIREEKNMSKKASILKVVVTVFLFIEAAQAGYIQEDSFYSSQGFFNYNYARLSLIEALPGISPVTVTGGGVSEGIDNLTFTIFKVVINESEIPWIGYILTLDPAESATFVPDTASSTVFETVNYLNLLTLEFLAPRFVLPGKSVGFQFDIHIPGPGPFTFSLTQQPIPEPASVALLGLGALVLLTRKRK